jgi:transcriptional regulator of PTS gene
MNGMEGYNHQKVKFSNRNLLFKHIITNDFLSRTDLANLTGLTKMTVTNIISELLQNNIIAENKDNPDTSKITTGRKPSTIELSAESPCVIGMYISHEFCYTVLSDLKANILYSRKLKLSQDESNDSLVAKLLQPFYFIRENYKRRLLGIGIASIGQVDSANGVLINPLFFYHMVNFPICDMISKATNLPVFLDNDSKVSALAEKTFGVGKQYNNFLYLGISNSIRAGIITNGELYENNSGLYGQVGHMSIDINGPKCYCGNNGCLEQYAGINKIVDKTCTRICDHKSSVLWGTIIEWIDIVEAAMANDYFATEIINEFCRYISIGLVNVVNILGPEMIVIGHEAAIGGELIQKKLETLINQRTIMPGAKKISVVISAFKDKTPIIGAVAIVIHKIFTGELQLY